MTESMSTDTDAGPDEGMGLYPDIDMGIPVAISHDLRRSGQYGRSHPGT